MLIRTFSDASGEGINAAEVETKEHSKVKITGCTLQKLYDIIEYVNL